METNPAGEVTRIFSDAFEQPGEGAVLIDQGSGDVYVHAQSHYLAKDIRDEYGRANYRWTGEALEEIPEEEKPEIPAPGRSENTKVQNLLLCLISHPSFFVLENREL